MSVPVEFTTSEGLRTLANFLRSQNGIKVRSGIEHEKRVDYFKGKKLIECILEPKKWPKSLPKVADEQVAKEIGELLLQANFFHRSEKVDEKKGYLRISQGNHFDDKSYFTWMYAGNMMWSNIATGLVIAVVIGFTLLPIWPDYAKRILWYFSVTFLISTLSFCLIRFVSFLILWVFGYEFWIFPRLFDESLSFQDSFKPMYSFERGSTGQGLYRMALIAGIVGFGYWAYSQPTEFDGFLKAQTEFIDDLYSGKLIADVAFDPRQHIEKHGKRVPSLEDLLKELERDEKSITENAAEPDVNAEEYIKPTEVDVDVDGSDSAAKDDEELDRLVEEQVESEA